MTNLSCASKRSAIAAKRYQRSAIGNGGTRGCFFDFKQYKPDLKKSLDSGNFCDQCRMALWKKFNQEINVAIQKMVATMKALRDDSTADIEAETLRGRLTLGLSPFGAANSKRCSTDSRLAG